VDGDLQSNWLVIELFLDRLIASQMIRSHFDNSFCYLLYDKIHREDILRHAYALARVNAGAPGVDGVTFATIEASGLEGWLAGLHEDFVSKIYRPAS